MTMGQQHTSGVSGLNSVADYWPFFRRNKTASILLLWCHPSVRKPRQSPEVAKLVDLSISDGPWMHLGGRDQQTFRLKTWCKCRGLQTLVWHHTSSMEACYVFSVVLFSLKKDSQLTSIVLDSAVTKFNPETPEVFCGLKHCCLAFTCVGLCGYFIYAWPCSAIAFDRYSPPCCPSFHH